MIKTKQRQLTDISLWARKRTGDPPAIPPCRATEGARAEPRASSWSGKAIFCRKPTACWGPGFPAGEMRGCVGNRDRGCAGQQDGSVPLLLSLAKGRRSCCLCSLGSSSSSGPPAGQQLQAWCLWDLLGQEMCCAGHWCLFWCLCSYAAGTSGHLLGTDMGLLIIHYTQGSVADIPDHLPPGPTVGCCSITIGTALFHFHLPLWKAYCHCPYPLGRALGLSCLP